MPLVMGPIIVSADVGSVGGRIESGAALMMGPILISAAARSVGG